jgi:hypothetical protein
MKIYWDADELYPYVRLVIDCGHRQFIKQIEIPDELVERYLKAQTAFEEAHTELENYRLKQQISIFRSVIRDYIDEDVTVNVEIKK